MFKKIARQLNVIEQCRKYNLSVWQCPQFLFLVMGGIIIISAVFLYLIGTYYFIDPETVVLIVLSVSVTLFIIAYTIINGFEKLAEVSKMKSDFISIVSHQMRSPLTNIKWAFELLSSDKERFTKEKKKRYFNDIKENIDRTIELVDNLLIVSRIEKKNMPVIKKEISFKELVKNLVLRFESFAKASKIKIKFNSSKNLPNVFTDDSLIKLVVENLVSNAINYTRENGQIDIDIKKEGENRIIFEIRDNGIGIPDEQQKYIFRKFFRAKNAFKKKTKGNGLGLHICKIILERLGGRIWFRSKEGKGTTFYFILPIN